MPIVTGSTKGSVRITLRNRQDALKDRGNGLSAVKHVKGMETLGRVGNKRNGYKPGQIICPACILGVRFFPPPNPPLNFFILPVRRVVAVYISQA